MLNTAKIRAAKKILSEGFQLTGGADKAEAMGEILNSLDELIICYENTNEL